MPALWAPEPGFASLIQIILEQQVSLASARVTFERLASVAPGVDPLLVGALGEAGVRGVGITRQKARYVIGLARDVSNGALDLGTLESQDDEEARSALLAIDGVGRWTADVYLLLVLRRPDVWPAGDLALASAVWRVKSLPRRPTIAEMESLGSPWRPWRAVAARLLWHSYLTGGRASRDR